MTRIKRISKPDRCGKCGSPHIIYSTLLNGWMCIEANCGWSKRNPAFRVPRRRRKGKRELAELDKLRKLGRLTFGRHKGKEISDVPTGYLQWMVQELAGRPEAQIAERELERRANPALR